jgi:methylenetetrahydrofolate reductase (NADPH)
MSNVQVGYEYFPPRAAAEPESLRHVVADLADADPWLVSVTTKPTSDCKAEETVQWFQQEQPVPVMPHVVCVGKSEDDARGLLERHRLRGVTHILALAGDRPPGPSPSGELRYASELVDVARSVGNFTVAVAVNPEPHPLADDRISDRKFQAAKLHEADFGISQYFFEAQSFDRLQTELSEQGNNKPLIPGILLSTSLPAIERMSQAAGITIPEPLHNQLKYAAERDTVAGNRSEISKVVVEHASSICDELIQNGTERLHLFTLNQSRLTRALLTNLGIIH